MPNHGTFKREPSETAIAAATAALDDVSPNKCGTSFVVDGWHIETHTLGCRKEAGTIESEWWDEHWQIFDDYDSDEISTVIGDPADGKFVTLSPSI